MKTAFWVVCLMLWGLSGTWASAGMVTVTDMVGRQVTAPRDPERIVCVGPGSLRLIVYLQAETKVAGVEDMEKMNPGGRPYWIAHPELSKLPRCGPGGPAGINKKPDLEAVLAVKPQVIFVTYMDGSLADEVQRTLGIPVIVLSYGAFASFDEAVYDALRIAGRVLNREKRADDIVTYVDSMRKDLWHRTADIPKDRRPTVYVGGIGYRGARGLESTERLYIPFEWVGADNVARQAEAHIGGNVLMDKEILLRLDPEFIFVDGSGLILVEEDYQKKRAYYHSLRAFAAGQVYTLLPFNWYATNIETALVDAYAIGKRLYGARFEDVDLERKADDIYRFLVGRPVYQEMIKDFGPAGRKAPFLDGR